MCCGQVGLTANVKLHFKALAWTFTYELLSLQAKPSDPLPPPYLYIVKIENFHPVLTRSLSVAIQYQFLKPKVRGSPHFWHL